MTELFKKEDILTTLTTDKAKIGDYGYFGDTLEDIKDSVECGKIYSLVWIDNKNLSVYSFKNDFFDDNFALFLPADKVKKLTYRALENINELFDFLMPDFNKDNVYDSNGNKIKVDTNKKAEYLLGKKITLKRKTNDWIKIMAIQDIKFTVDNNDSNNTYLNDISLTFLFERYEILIDGEFVPFGVEE